MKTVKKNRDLHPNNEKTRIGGENQWKMSACNENAKNEILSPTIKKNWNPWSAVVLGAKKGINKNVQCLRSTKMLRMERPVKNA